MKHFNLFYLMTACLIIFSCAPAFKKGGYFFTDDHHFSYYANDRKNIYIHLSDHYSYDKEYFNSNNLLPKDVELLQEFNIKPKKILFSYHSTSGRESISLLQNKGEIDFKKFERSKNENKKFFYRTEIRGKVTYRENIFLFKNKWIHVIEKSPSAFNIRTDSGNINKSRIFPSISNIKPKK